MEEDRPRGAYGSTTTCSSNYSKCLIYHRTSKIWMFYDKSGIWCLMLDPTRPLSCAVGDVQALLR